MPSVTRKNRSERLNVRATKKQAQLIRLGAREAQSNISNFILESACLRAQHALASKQHFVLDSQAWAEFMSALDRPPQEKPNLRKLLHEPSVLESR